MAQSIVIVGGLPGDPDRKTVLNRLKERTEDDITWDWVRADADGSYQPPEKFVRRLTGRIRQEKDGQTKVVKLPLLHNRTQNNLHQATDPVQVPRDLNTVDEVIEWLFSREANLVPVREWFGSVREAAMMAILSKLIRNKSWNKDTQGHEWTKEEDLLGQAPVDRPKHQQVAIEARSMMGRLKSRGLLLDKGGTAGTPKEWSINIRFLPLVKQTVVQQCFAPLETDASLKPIVTYVGDKDRTIRIDGEIVSERVRGTCQI